jgi:hypothetical protein
MKRWFVCRLVEVDPNEWEPKVGSYPNVNYRVWTKTGFNFCLGQLATNNVSQFGDDNDIRIMPDASLDNTWGTVPAGTRSAVQTFLTNAGFTFTGLNNQSTIREILQHLKGQLQTDTDVESGDVVDVEG